VAVAGATGLIVLMLLFLGPTKLLPIAFALLIIAIATGRLRLAGL